MDSNLCAGRFCKAQAETGKVKGFLAAVVAAALAHSAAAAARAAVARAVVMVNRVEDRMLEEAEGHLRPGDELAWIDGATYRRMSDGSIAVYLPERRRRQRPSFYWASQREEWERERVAAEIARLRETTERFELGRGKDDY